MSREVEGHELHDPVRKFHEMQVRSLDSVAFLAQAVP